MWSIFFSLFILTSMSHANNKVGNGGDVILCEGSKKSNTLLDFYESGMNLRYKNKNYEAVIESVLAQFQKVDAKLATQYSKRFQSMKTEIDFKSDIELSDIADSKHLFKPSDKNCKVLQIAIRKTISTTNEKRFLIQKNLWEKLDATNQAGLLLHEIIYEHFSKLGETDSLKARKLNSLIFQGDLNKKSFWNWMTEMELSIYP